MVSKSLSFPSVEISILHSSFTALAAIPVVPTIVPSLLQFLFLWLYRSSHLCGIPLNLFSDLPWSSSPWVALAPATASSPAATYLTNPLHWTRSFGKYWFTASGTSWALSSALSRISLQLTFSSEHCNCPPYLAFSWMSGSLPSSCLATINLNHKFQIRKLSHL